MSLGEKFEFGVIYYPSIFAHFAMHIREMGCLKKTSVRQLQFPFIKGERESGSLSLFHFTDGFAGADKLNSPVQFKRHIFSSATPCRNLWYVYGAVDYAQTRSAAVPLVWSKTTGKFFRSEPTLPWILPWANRNRFIQRYVSPTASVFKRGIPFKSNYNFLPLIQTVTAIADTNWHIYSCIW